MNIVRNNDCQIIDDALPHSSMFGKAQPNCWFLFYLTFFFQYFFVPFRVRCLRRNSKKHKSSSFEIADLKKEKKNAKCYECNSLKYKFRIPIRNVILLFLIFAFLLFGQRTSEKKKRMKILSSSRLLLCRE